MAEEEMVLPDEVARYLNRLGPGEHQDVVARWVVRCHAALSLLALLHRPHEAPPGRTQVQHLHSMRELVMTAPGHLPEA